MVRKFILIIPIILFFFTGCLNIEQETFIGSDGSGSSIIHYWTDIEAMYRDTSATNKFSFFESTIRKNFEDENIEIKSIRIWEKKEDSTYHAEIKIVFDDINKLNRCKFFKDEIIEFIDGATGQKIFKQLVKKFDFPKNNQQKYYIKYVYHLPGSIITDNAHEKRNNTLTWKFSLDQLDNDKTLTATIKIPTGSKFSDYLISILIIFLVFLWVILIVKKLKSRRESESNTE